MKILSNKEYRRLLRKIDDAEERAKHHFHLAEERLFIIKMVRTLFPLAIKEVEEQIRDEMILNFNNQK